MNLEQTRFNMVEQQIRTWDVLDPEVIKLLFELRREEFVPASYRDLAFVDMEIPLGHGEVMLAPKMEARILQELHVKMEILKLLNLKLKPYGLFTNYFSRARRYHI